MTKPTLGELHMKTVHPDGSECPDGCDAGPMRRPVTIIMESVLAYQVWLPPGVETLEQFHDLMDEDEDFAEKFWEDFDDWSEGFGHHGFWPAEITKGKTDK